MPKKPVRLGNRPPPTSPTFLSGSSAPSFRPARIGSEKLVELELLDYFRRMTTPEGGRFLFARSGYNWSDNEDESFHGIVLEDASAIDEAYRVLKPGGHLMLVAPEEEPTGHTGACKAEDIGFEVRDAFLILEGGVGFYYEAKPPTKEKEAGLAHLSEREESEERKNIHPTVKPSSIMERLMEEIPEGETVADIFLGSGTTGIAALRTNHDFIGVEKERGYLEIADARIRHWREAQSGWKAVVITSDLDPPAPESEGPESPVDLDDFFGF
jgi:DNA modification methylase